MDLIFYGINESRFWLYPLLLGVVVALVAVTIGDVIATVQREIEDRADHRP